MTPNTTYLDGLKNGTYVHNYKEVSDFKTIQLTTCDIDFFFFLPSVSSWKLKKQEARKV